jgi:hypothetical protein
MTKIKSMGNSRAHAHFTKHLVCVIENPSQEYNKH